MLQNTFRQLVTAYTQDEPLIQKLWNEIAQKHSEKGRHYHTLIHLENLVIELSQVQQDIEDWNTLLFAVFYHDSVYNVLKNDNEETSALLAVERLTQLGVAPENRLRCRLHILATKGHQTMDDGDTNLFTDADLSVLGKPWEVYEAYSRQVRQEYHIYPGLVYKPGRKKVLQHFLQMPQIYKTPFFYQQYEQQARVNLQQELDRL